MMREILTNYHDSQPGLNYLHFLSVRASLSLVNLKLIVNLQLNLYLNNGEKNLGM